VPEHGGQRPVRLRHNPVLCVEGEDGREMGQDVGVVLEFWVSGAMADLRWHTGGMVATFMTS
jgi:hypothetical protein